MRQKWQDPDYRQKALGNRPKGPRIKDGLTKTERYRAKDVDAYRKLKREFARTEAERAKRVAYMRIWREKNRARHNELCRQSSKRNRHKHIEKNRDDHYRRQYGIGAKDKQAMVESQGGVCAICAQAFKSSRNTHVDHCHRTGAIRGILCNVCNTKLEWFETNGPAVVAYLNRSSKSA